MWEIIISVLYICVCCCFDIKSKKIPIVLFIIGGFLSVIDIMMQSILGNISEVLPGKLIGLLPGVFLLLLSRLTNEKVGEGDGILLMILGVMLGFDSILIISCTALFLQSIVACFLLVVKKADKQTKIPYVPFLLAGFITIIVSNIFPRYL